jgi:hypothetical protein
MSATVSTLLQDINIKDGNFVDRLDNRTLYQANDYKLQLTFLDGNDRADGTDLAFSFVVQSTSGEVFDIAGVWTTATSGEGTITVPAASLNFTGTDYIGLIRFNGSVVAEFPLVVKAYGTPAPAAGTVIDWSIYTGYTNTATDGPVRPDGVTTEVATTNADGSIDIGVIDGVYQEVLAEGAFVDGDKTKLDGIEDGATAGGGSWGEISGTLSDQTDLQTALDAKADDNEVVKLTGNQTKTGNLTLANATHRESSGNTVIENETDGKNIFIRSHKTGNVGVNDLVLNDQGGRILLNNAQPHADNIHVMGTASLRWLSSAITTILSTTLKALATTGLVVQNSAGTEKLKVGAATGADVQVTGDLSVTEKQATVYSLSDSRDAVMVGDETLTLTSATNQYLDPADADRNLDLPNASVFIISNVGDGAEIITVRDEANATIDTIDNGVTLRFQWTGSAWRVS